MRVSPERLREWRKLRGEGMVSAVGEYTPDEFWLVLDELESARTRLEGVRTALEAIRDNTTDRVPPFRAIGTTGPVRDVAVAALAMLAQSAEQGEQG